jgi:ubiquinone biosynthesis protein UbiJ
MRKRMRGQRALHAGWGIMGRNEDLREKIRSTRRIIEEHREKIRSEEERPNPRRELIAYWEAEIEGLEVRVARLTRRLERKW